MNKKSLVLKGKKVTDREQEAGFFMEGRKDERESEQEVGYFERGGEVGCVCVKETVNKQTNNAPHPPTPKTTTKKKKKKKKKKHKLGVLKGRKERNKP